MRGWGLRFCSKRPCEKQAGVHAIPVTETHTHEQKRNERKSDKEAGDTERGLTLETRARPCSCCRQRFFRFSGYISHSGTTVFLLDALFRCQGPSGRVMLCTMTFPCSEFRTHLEQKCQRKLSGSCLNTARTSVCTTYHWTDPQESTTGKPL